jgi:sodium transport system ATP-binding protein
VLVVEGLGKSFRLPRRSKRGADAAEVDPRQEGREFHAVREVSFRAEAGEILGLLGPNGAGKTTLLRTLSTALAPSRGTASFDGIDIRKEPRRVRERIGFLSGSTGLYGRLTPREMVAYYARLHGVGAAELPKRIDALFSRLEMQSFADKRNDDLSTGMKQKVSIARTLVHDPDIVILDEPTSGLDVHAAAAILDLIERLRADRKTVLFSTHHMHEVDRLCDRVVVVDVGEKRFEGDLAAMRHAGGHEALDRAFLGLLGHGGRAA